MQDCGEDLVRIIRNGEGFALEFTCRSTGRKIIMHVPSRTQHGPERDVTEADVVRLAAEIARAFGARVV